MSMEIKRLDPLLITKENIRNLLKDTIRTVLKREILLHTKAIAI